MTFAPHQHHQQNLHDALEQLETCLLTPLVPGELEPWIEDVRAQLEAVESLLHGEVAESHRQELEQITGEDPGLVPRVEQLQAEDKATLVQAGDLLKRVGKLSEKARKIEPDEAKVQKEVAAFADRGIEFVIHVRRQETALRTWLQEALERDRGTVD